MSPTARRKNCRRVAFENRMQAVEWMRTKAYSNKRTGQVPIRAYPCTRCGKWHLTSKPQPKSKG